MILTGAIKPSCMSVTMFSIFTPAPDPITTCTPKGGGPPAYRARFRISAKKARAKSRRSSRATTRKPVAAKVRS